MSRCILIVLLLCGASAIAAFSNTTACGAVKFSDAESIRACVAATGGTKGRLGHEFIDPGSSCVAISQELAMTRAQQREGRSLGFDDKIKFGQRPWPDDDPLNCTIIADLIEEYRGQRPYWAACIGYEAAENRGEFTLSCIRAWAEYRSTIPGEATSSGAPVEAFLPGNCADFMKAASSAFATVYGPDNSLPPERATLPYGFEEPDCDNLAPVFAEAADGAAAATRLKREHHATLSSTPSSQPRVNLRSAMAETLQRNLDEMSQNALRAWQSRRFEASGVSRAALEWALTFELHRLYPAKTQMFTFQNVTFKIETLHSSSGVTSRSRSIGPSLTTYFGARDVGTPDCHL